MKKLFITLTVFFAVIYLQAKEPTEPKVKKNHQPKLAHTYVKAKDWSTDLFIGFIKLFLPVWGKYNEGGTTNRNIPLLTSDRKNQDINKLRDLLSVV